MTTEVKKDKSNSGVILNQLLEGNKEYAEGKRLVADVGAEADLSASPQFPKSVIVSCLDSRVPVEQVFNQGVGDMFVARVAGNVMNEDIVGSLEFAVLANDVRLVMVIGHTSCGAVKGCCAGVELGQLTQLLDKIKPAIKMAEERVGDSVAKDSVEFYDKVSAMNAVHAAEELKRMSPGIAERVENGEVLVVAALYDLKTQKVTVLD